MLAWSEARRSREKVVIAARWRETAGFGWEEVVGTLGNGDGISTSNHILLIFLMVIKYGCYGGVDSEWVAFILWKLNLSLCIDEAFEKKKKLISSSAKLHSLFLFDFDILAFLTKFIKIL